MPFYISRTPRSAKVNSYRSSIQEQQKISSGQTLRHCSDFHKSPKVAIKRCHLKGLPVANHALRIDPDQIRIHPTVDHLPLSRSFCARSRTSLIIFYHSVFSFDSDWTPKNNLFDLLTNLIYPHLNLKVHAISASPSSPQTSNSLADR